MKHFPTLFLVVALIFTMACARNNSQNQTYHAPKNTDWAKGIVWYQIFPERFYNGDPSDDPTPAEVPGSDLQPGWRIHPWTSDWYKIQPWERKQSDYFYDVVFTRRYGGDLIGLIKKLDYLQKLGIDAIYFNPVFESPSLHKYDSEGYHHIDNNFGPDSKGDLQRVAAAHETDDPKTWIWTKADSTFLELIRQAHARGIRIVIDGVFNHTGNQCFAFKDVVKNQQKSRYANWYDIISWDNPKTPQNEFKYKGWWGVQTLPELNEDANGIVHGPREYIFNCTRRWMDPNGDGDPSDGIDGWRLDVAEEVAKPFWKDWYALVKSINPGAITVDEIWHVAPDWIRDKCTDAIMNYDFARNVVAFFINHKKAISASEFANRMNKLKESYGLSHFQLLWSMLDSHDTDRLPSQVLNPDRPYNSQNSPRNNPNYVVRKPNASECQIQKQIVAFQMTFAGAPIVYYGDEAGMWGAADPDDRKPMLWPDMHFDPETHHPLKGKTRPADKNRFDPKLFRFYQRLIQIRHQNPVLQSGDFQFLANLNSDDVFAVVRSLNKSRALLIFNRKNKPVPVTITDPELTQTIFTDAISHQKIKAKNGKLNVMAGARGFRILIANE